MPGRDGYQIDIVGGTACNEDQFADGEGNRDSEKGRHGQIATIGSPLHAQLRDAKPGELANGTAAHIEIEIGQRNRGAGSQLQIVCTRLEPIFHRRNSMVSPHSFLA
jgi:hypothetical protein